MADRNKAAAGWSHTDEAKAKISEANRQREYHEHTPETKAKISQALTGRKQDPEVVARRAEGARRAWALKRAQEKIS